MQQLLNLLAGSVGMLVPPTLRLAQLFHAHSDVLTARLNRLDAYDLMQQQARVRVCPACGCAGLQEGHPRRGSSLWYNFLGS